MHIITVKHWINWGANNLMRVNGLIHAVSDHSIIDPEGDNSFKDRNMQVTSSDVIVNKFSTMA